MTARKKKFLLQALLAAEDKKAEDVVVLDLEGISSVTDFFLIAGGGSDTHVRAISDGIREKLAQEGIEPLGVEGYNEGTWILLDYVDFVVHVFHREKRIFFALEHLWSDAARLRKEDLEGNEKGNTRH